MMITLDGIDEAIEIDFLKSNSTIASLVAHTIEKLNRHWHERHGHESDEPATKAQPDHIYVVLVLEATSASDTYLSQFPRINRPICSFGVKIHMRSCARRRTRTCNCSDI